jgi:hypothetical protein
MLKTQLEKAELLELFLVVGRPASVGTLGRKRIPILNTILVYRVSKLLIGSLKRESVNEILKNTINTIESSTTRPRVDQIKFSRT